MEEIKQRDKFESHLDIMVNKLKECQGTKAVVSCSICNEYLVCILRDDYVKSVYNSMSKGDTGGFEF